MKELTLRSLSLADENALSDYLNNLSAETRNRFGPHPFDRETVRQICAGNYLDYTGYVAEHTHQGLIAYAVVRKGYLDFELPRLAGYPLALDFVHDYTLAPSVGDAWQSKGIGSVLLQYILNELNRIGAHKIVLWGGVQASNHRAIKFYEKFDFQVLGEFEYNGLNYDMVCYLAANRAGKG